LSVQFSRILAYLLAVVCGAALMFAVDRVWNADRVINPMDRPGDPPVVRPVKPDQTKQAAQVPAAAVAQPASPPVDPNVLHVQGITEPAPGRFAKLPLATSQPVAFVDVKPGDRVKKGWQVFSHWESPERLQVVK
jgi:biotin carboxyl carrier protein